MKVTAELRCNNCDHAAGVDDALDLIGVRCGEGVTDLIGCDACGMKQATLEGLNVDALAERQTGEASGRYVPTALRYSNPAIHANSAVIECRSEGGMIVVDKTRFNIRFENESEVGVTIRIDPKV